eukprot:jgi/Mesvir1/16833/Mv15727-RA.1
MSDVRVLTIHSDAANVTDATTSAANEWVVTVSADESAPLLGPRWKMHLLYACVKGFVPAGTSRNYLPVANPRLLRDGGSFRVRVCHLDAASPLTAGARPVVGDWTLVLRLEMLGSKPRT